LHYSYHNIKVVDGKIYIISQFKKGIHFLKKKKRSLVLRSIRKPRQPNYDQSQKKIEHITSLDVVDSKDYLEGIEVKKDFCNYDGI
jgi:hypothetical protein